MGRKKYVAQYNAAVGNLELMKKLNLDLRQVFPQFSVPMRPINEALRKAQKALARKEAQ